MFSLSRVLWRLVVVAFGWLAAVIASIVIVATAVAVIPTLDAVHAITDAPADPRILPLGGYLRHVMNGGAVVPALILTIWPAWSIAALLAEVAAARSLLVHVFGAALIAVAGLLATLPLAGGAAIQLVAAAGLTAGFAHWLVAGRSAGFRSPFDGKGDPRQPHA